MPTTVPDIIYSDGAGLTLKASEFRQISELAYQRFGLDLKKGKEALVAARLGTRLRQKGIQSFAEYYRYVLDDPSGEALIELIDSLTTNHTSFMRERAHFEFLARAVQEEFREIPTLEIWSAASSTGEEPYSIAMCLSEALSRGAENRGRSFRILATDISTRVLAHAQRGVYPAERFKELPETWRREYLLRGERECKGSYKIKPDLASHVEYQRLNLIEPFTHRRRFHVIFCRNVMMYFAKSTQQDVVGRMGACLEPGGYLFVGHSESLTGVEHELKYVRPATYRAEKPGGVLRSWS
ncbi:MAG TPA: protein-glutamate O-methyltransferase [Bryobacteraceae bacterium]|jgi:chemotaxis protein methyltransferase CheR|nr:protein-glutamate O-methyltransferase [Bryobacteraceae bacterium]